MIISENLTAGFRTILGSVGVQLAMALYVLLILRDIEKPFAPESSFDPD